MKCPAVTQLEYATSHDARAPDAWMLRCLCVALAAIVLAPCFVAALVVSILMATAP